jgi:hypothetical protein
MSYATGVNREFFVRPLFWSALTGEFESKVDEPQGRKHSLGNIAVHAFKSGELTNLSVSGWVYDTQKFSVQPSWIYPLDASIYCDYDSGSRVTHILNKIVIQNRHGEALCVTDTSDDRPNTLLLSQPGSPDRSYNTLTQDPKFDVTTAALIFVNRYND